MSGDQSIVEGLLRACDARPDAIAARFLADMGGETERSYAALLAGAQRVAGVLQAAGIGRGDRAVLLYPPGMDFVEAFWGSLLAGVVAVPLPPPNFRRLERTLPRLLAAVRSSAPRAILTIDAIRQVAGSFGGALPQLAQLAMISTDTATAPPAPIVRPASGELAFLQYTSGSTSDPKGVMVTHGNLVHNCASLAEFMELDTAKGQVVSWLPMFHDMGLIAHLLTPLSRGASTTFMSPLAFLKEPKRWLTEMTRWRATASGAPNFAFDLACNAIERHGSDGIDLRTVRTVFNGAEPIRAETITRFRNLMAPLGFASGALIPGYGLAEGTLLVSGNAPELPKPITPVDPAALERGVFAPLPGGRPLVSCGPVRHFEAVIVDPETGMAALRGKVGELWLAGPSVAAGYFGNEAATRELFGARLPDGRGPYLRTGDFAVIWEEHLYITGRLKDIIIVNGANHYPQDLELTAERAHPRVRPHCVAAFLDDAAGGLVIVAEIERRSPTAPPEIEARRAWPVYPEHPVEDQFDGRFERVGDAVRTAISRQHELPVARVVLIRPGALPKTTSGKVQRRRCRAEIADGTIEALAVLT